jgi:hypothetical protein
LISFKLMVIGPKRVQDFTQFLSIGHLADKEGA